MQLQDLNHLRIVPATPSDLDRYIDLLEEVADWLAERGIKQWRTGSFRLCTDYYAESIAHGEVQLAFVDAALVGTLRLLLQEPIVWPDLAADDAVYVYNLAVRRQWAHQQVGRRLLGWAADRALEVSRPYVRLDCLADNTFFRRYYQQAGFVERGEIAARFTAPGARSGCGETRSSEAPWRAGRPSGTAPDWLDAHRPRSGVGLIEQVPTVSRSAASVLGCVACQPA